MAGNGAAGRRILRVEEFLPYPADRVWHVLTAPDQVAHWLPVNGFRLERGYQIPIETDPVRQIGTGGTGQFEVLAFDEEHMLRVGWSASRAEERGLDSTVTFTLADEGTGTRLLIEHDGRHPCGMVIGTSRGRASARIVGDVPETVAAWRARVGRIGDLLAADA